jgi:formylglycine-generating enzyme required for sulfatase activity
MWSRQENRRKRWEWAPENGKKSQKTMQEPLLKTALNSLPWPLAQHGRHNTKTIMLFLLLLVATTTIVLFVYANDINVAIACYADADCNDLNQATTDICNNPGSMESNCTNINLKPGPGQEPGKEPNTEPDQEPDRGQESDQNAPDTGTPDLNTTCQIECIQDKDCNDQNTSTIDICNNDATCESSCSNIPMPECNITCTKDKDCDDNDAATLDICNNDAGCESSCSNIAIGPESDQNAIDDNATCEIACSRDKDCNDQNKSTIDICNNDATCESSCSNVLMPECKIACSKDRDCDDDNNVTIDICNNDNTCESNCSNIWPMGDCEISCENDSECDDQDSNTTDKCANALACESRCINFEEGKIKEASKKLKPEPLPDVSGRNPNIRRLYTDSDCGDTRYEEIDENGFVHRLENNCLRAEFTSSMSNVRIYSFTEGKEFSFVPQSIEEMDPGNTAENFRDDKVVEKIDFASNPFEPEFEQKPNLLGEDGFEEGRLVWSLNYQGANIHIYYKLVRGYLKWGLEIENWPFQTEENYLRLAHETQFETDPSMLAQEKQVTFKKNNKPYAYAQFYPPKNNGEQTDQNSWFERKAGKNLIHQNLGNAELIELDPTLSLSLDTNDGAVRYESGAYDSVYTDNVKAGFDNIGADYFWDRAILQYHIGSIALITSATFHLDYQSSLGEKAGTFDLLSVDSGNDIDQADWDSQVFETVSENWFDCSTIADDIATSVTTAWNNAKTADRNYLHFRLWLDDDNTDPDRLNKNNECFADFYDTGEEGVDPYIDYTQPPLDVNVWKIDSLEDDGALPEFSYQADLNLTIDFNVFKSGGGSLTVDINYSPTNVLDKQGTVIVSGLTLNMSVCDDADFSDVTKCGWDWNISGVADGNYHINIEISDGTNTDWNASDNNFKIDNTAPDTNVWKIEAYDVNGGLPSFTYSTDGNLTIDFNVTVNDKNFGLHYADINYSTDNNQGSGTIIIENLILDGNHCISNLIGGYTGLGTDANLIGYWTFNGGEADTNQIALYDYSGNENTGHYVNGANNDTQGKWDTNAGFFDGANDQIKIPATIDMYDLNNSFTLSTWFNASGTQNQDATILSRTGFFWIGYNYDRDLEFVVRDQNSDQNYNTLDNTYLIKRTTSTVANNQWNQVTASFDGTNMSLYLNGTLQSSGTITQALNPYCIDQYEASHSDATFCDNDRSWAYPGDCNLHYGTSSTPASQPNRIPWVNINQTDAATACATAGKHLCSSAEWMAAANLNGQIYDLDNTTTASTCIVSVTLLCLNHSDTNGEACNTGGNKDVNAPSNCKSAEGVFDLIGNVMEWTSDVVDVNVEGLDNGWNYPNDDVPGMYGNATPSLHYGNDAVYTTTSKIGRAVARGGAWNNGTYAGLFIIGLSGTSGSSGGSLGFRCCDKPTAYETCDVNMAFINPKIKLGNDANTFKGKIEETKIYNKALTATEISMDFSIGHAAGTGTSWE